MFPIRMFLCMLVSSVLEDIWKDSQYWSGVTHFKALLKVYVWTVMQIGHLRASYSDDLLVEEL